MFLKYPHKIIKYHRIPPNLGVVSIFNFSAAITSAILLKVHIQQIAGVGWQGKV